MQQINNMKYLFTIIILLTSAFSCKSQEKKYLVYIFHEDWKKNSLKWNTGDYLWIIPYDSCCTKIDVTQLKPLFVTEEQKFFLHDTDSKKLGIGELPIILNDKSDYYGYMLFKNKKLTQKYEYKKIYSNIKRVLKVYVVPVKAICEEDYLGVYKKRVMRIDHTLEIWNSFWKDYPTKTNPYLFCDFSAFNFIVSYNK